MSVTPGFVGILDVESCYTRAKNAQLQLQLPAGTQCCSLDSTWAIPIKRNELVARCLADERNQWLCFLDSDMVPPPDMVQTLWGTGEAIVSGLYFKRVPPHGPVCGLGHDAATMDGLRQISRSDPLVPVDWCGAGCLLIRRHVLQAIKPPWFYYRSTTWASDTPGEDCEFCWRAKQAGFQPWVLTSLVVGHLTVQEVGLEDAVRHGQIEALD